MTSPLRLAWLVWIPVLAGVAALLVDGAGTAGATQLPLDDAWIHLVYARNVLEHGVFGYRPGEWENGSTAPLWSLLLVPSLAAGLAPAVAGKVTSLLSGFLLIGAVARLAGRPGGPLGAFVAGGIVALDPILGVLAVSGMEPLAAAACGLLATDAALSNRPGRAGLWLAAAGLLRPELGLLGLLLPLGLPPRHWPRLLSAPAAAGLAWLAFGACVTGHLLPNTFLVKSVHIADLAGQARNVASFWLGGPLRAVAPALALVVGGACSCGLRGRPGRRLLLAALVLFPAGVVAFHLLRVALPPDRGWFVAWSSRSLYNVRYHLLVAPFLAVLLATGLATLVGATARKAGPWLAGALTAAIVLLAAPPWQALRSVTGTVYRLNCEEIGRLQVQTGRWIQRTLPSDAVVAVSDAGALAWWGGRTPLDLVGLNDHRLLDAPDRVAWLLDRGVTHATLWPFWHPDLLSDPRLVFTPVHVAEVSQNTVAAGPRLVTFEVRPAPDPGPTGPRSSCPPP